MSTKPFILVLLLAIITITLPAQDKLERLQKFGNNIEDAVLEEDLDLLDSYFSTEGFLDKVLVKGKSKDIKFLNAGFTDAMTKTSLAQKVILAPVVSDDNDYQLVRAYYKKDQPHLLFRLSGDGGINYHDMLLKPYGLNSFQIVDIYYYYSGEYISETIQRVYLTLGRKAFSKKTVKGLPDYSIEDINKINEIKKLVEQGDFKKAADQMTGLSEEARKEKVFRLIELNIKSNLNDQEYMNALTAYKNSFPNDASANLISIDYLFYNEEYDKLLKVIDNLDKQVGGDTYLNLYRGSAYLASGKREIAEKILIQFNQDHPDQLDGHFMLLEMYIDDKRFADCIKTLETVTEDFYIEKSDLIDIIEDEPLYKALTEATEFTDWKKAN